MASLADQPLTEIPSTLSFGRHINFEEFRRFLGKEPREDEASKKENKNKKKRLKVHVSNLTFFWDGIEWLSFTP